MKMISNISDWPALRDLSKGEPVIIFKHSRLCPTSAAALERLSASAVGREVYRLDVQSARPLSDLIAQETGIRHESPQVIIIRDGRAVYDADHDDIRPELIEARI